MAWSLLPRLRSRSDLKIANTARSGEKRKAPLSPIRRDTSAKRPARAPPKRCDFSKIGALFSEETERLDKLRNDLQALIERTVRIKKAFERKLRTVARH